MRRLGAGLVGTVMLCTATSCATAPSPTTPRSASPTATVSATPTTTPPAPVRVVVIVMENRAYPDVVGLPYVASLATSASVLSNYHAVAHPSLPNYLALTSGTTWGITDDGYHRLPNVDIGDQLSGAGIPWRAYMESMGADCRSNTALYAVKHDPFAYYGGRCPPNVVPLSAFAADLASAGAPRFMWITPNLCHDMHDCSSAAGDAWLRATVPRILAAPSMRSGVLFITWDEDDGSTGNHVLTLVLGAFRPSTPGAAYSHVSLLATVEDLFGLPRLPATRGVAALALR